jgi:hypothetical protein
MRRRRTCSPSGVSVGGNKPSGRYVLVVGRADEKDGLRQTITTVVVKPRVTYRVAGWISLGAGAAQGTVRVNLAVDENGDETLVECGGVCAEAGVSTEIMGAFRLRTEPCNAAVYVDGASSRSWISVSSRWTAKRASPGQN